MREEKHTPVLEETGENSVKVDRLGLGFGDDLRIGRTVELRAFDVAGFQPERRFIRLARKRAFRTAEPFGLDLGFTRRTYEKFNDF
jgi:hypothetical protein